MRALIVEALRWYAEQARLCRLIHSEGDAGRNALAADGGQRARDALAAAEAQPVPAGPFDIRAIVQQAALALEELQGPGFLIGGVMHYRIGVILPKLNEAIDALAAPPAQPAAPAEPIPTGEATDSYFGAFQDAAR